MTAQAQARHLRLRFPRAQCQVVAGELRWRGTLRPTPMSNQYVVRLRYRRAAVDCWVVHPKLEQRNGEHPPHLYPSKDPTDLLCLFLPRANEWDGSQAIATTIVPWASEWLFFYEAWLATGEWLGGGEHPS